MAKRITGSLGQMLASTTGGNMAGGLAAIAPSPTPGVALGAAGARPELVAERPVAPARKAGRGWAALVISGLLHGVALAAVVTEVARPQAGQLTGTVQVSLVSRLPPDPTPANLSHPFSARNLAAPPPGQADPARPAPDAPRLSQTAPLPAPPLTPLRAPVSETAPMPIDLPPPPAQAAPEPKTQARPKMDQPTQTAPHVPPVDHRSVTRKAPSPPPARAASGGAPAQAGRTGAQGPSTAQGSLMADWARQLVTRIEEHKRYPVAAGDARGVVSLQIALDAGGRLLSVAVAQGSGSAALDLAALQAVRAAAPFSHAPEGLSANRYDFRLQVRYAPTW